MYINLQLTKIFNIFNDDDGCFDKKHILIFNNLLQLLQLSLVHEELAFIKINKQKAEKYLDSLGAANTWNNLFTYDELRINMRQHDELVIKKCCLEFDLEL